jgi:hypothetical protein
MASSQPVSDKSTTEIVTLWVDYSSVSSTVSSVDVTVTVQSGKPDPSPNLLKLGSPAIDGSMVYQKIVGGVAGCKYKVRFVATFPSGDRYTQDLIIMVTE